MLGLLVPASHTFAQRLRCATIYYEDGTNIDIGCAEVFEADWASMTITAGDTKQTLQFPLEGLKGWDYYFKDSPILTGTELVKDFDIKLKLFPGEIKILSQGKNSIRLRHISGVPSLSFQPAPDTSIPTSSLPQGVYVVSCGTSIFKILIHN